MFVGVLYSYWFNVKIQKTKKMLQKVSKYIKTQKMKYIAHLIREDVTEPTREATFYTDIHPNTGHKNA